MKAIAGSKGMPSGYTYEVNGQTVPDDGSSLFGERPLSVELLTNKITGKERQRVLAALAQGEVDLLIGTHALIQEAVDFKSLGVVVIDEQHRFGVEQRAALKDKAGGGAVPDVLVMTATPIPRTAAMTVYGDLDVSILGEKPAGRQPIVTTWAKGDDDEAVLPEDNDNDDVTPGDSTDLNDSACNPLVGGNPLLNEDGSLPL